MGGPAIGEGEPEAVGRESRRDMVEVRRPAALRAAPVYRDDPDDEAVGAPQRAREAIDGWRDLARDRNFGDGAGGAKPRLQIHDQQRGFAGIDGLERLHAAATPQRNVDCLSRDGDAVQLGRS